MKRQSAALFSLSFAVVFACAQKDQTGYFCASDGDCDPGDVCSDGECTQALTEADTITVTPAEQLVNATVGQAPANASFSLTNHATTNHVLVISCSGGATALRPQMTIAPAASGPDQIVIPAPQSAGTNTISCTVDSTTGKTTWATISITLVATDLDGGTGNSDAGSADAGPADAGAADAGSTDAGPADAGNGGFTGPVGSTGGTVDLLDFTLTGDTRPPGCEQTQNYPTAIHAQIVKSMAALNPQFALDLGDHMYVCNKDLATAQAQMNLYVQGLAGFNAPFFMTMGNHECNNGADCSTNPADANYTAFSTALLQVSHQTHPYYAVQIQTRLGRATVVVVADNFFDATAQAWLQNTLADADANSVYTIVAKHHPMTGSRSGPQGTITMIENHKYSLILTAHDHDYSHATTVLGGRSVICGLGGANAAHTGFCRVQQQPSGNLNFTQYDISGNPGATWAVTAR